MRNDEKNSVTRQEKVWGIVPCAGIGQRMLSKLPKQYLPLCGRRVLDHALLALCRSDVVDAVIVGIREGDRYWQEQPFEHEKVQGISRGGETRAHTVLNALQQLLADNLATCSDWAMVHDGVRPCLSLSDIENLVGAARSHADGAILGVKLTDTLKRGDDRQHMVNTMEREQTYWRALTPQMFRCGALRDALQCAITQGRVATDESAAMEMSGYRPLAVEGNPANIKITTPTDLELASLYLAGNYETSMSETV